MSYTPGPWGLMMHREGHYVLTPPDGRCATFAALPAEDAEDHANARLIAAAPDLLAALKELLAACLTETTLRESASRRSQARDAARDAIAKATGAA